MLIESRAGWQVVAEAGTGREAMALAGSQRPDIVLLDLALDQENGVELIAPLLEAAAGAKVIVLTGLREPVRSPGGREPRGAGSGDERPRLGGPSQSDRSAARWLRVVPQLLPIAIVIVLVIAIVIDPISQALAPATLQP